MRALLAVMAAAVALLLGWLAWQSQLPEHKPDAPAGATGTDESVAEASEPVDRPSPSRQEPDDPEEVLATMREVRDCYQNPGCAVGDQADPRAEYFEAGQRIADGLHALIGAHEAGRLRDGELARAALEFLTMESGRGRAAAIEALGRVPPSPEHLDALLTTLEQHHDEKLFELAMAEFQRYLDLGYRDRIDAFLLSNLRTGARFSTRTIAENLDAFITPDNEHRYRALLEELPEDSWRVALLEEALSE